VLRQRHVLAFSSRGTGVTEAVVRIIHKNRYVAHDVMITSFQNNTFASHSIGCVCLIE